MRPANAKGSRWVSCYYANHETTPCQNELPYDGVTPAAQRICGRCGRPQDGSRCIYPYNDLSSYDPAQTFDVRVGAGERMRVAKIVVSTEAWFFHMLFLGDESIPASWFGTYFAGAGWQMTATLKTALDGLGVAHPDWDPTMPCFFVLPYSHMIPGSELIAFFIGWGSVEANNTAANIQASMRLNAGYEGWCFRLEDYVAPHVPTDGPIRGTGTVLNPGTYRLAGEAKFSGKHPLSDTAYWTEVA